MEDFWNTSETAPSTLDAFFDEESNIEWTGCHQNDYTLSHSHHMTPNESSDPLRLEAPATREEVVTHDSIVDNISIQDEAGYPAVSMGKGIKTLSLGEKIESWKPSTVAIKWKSTSDRCLQCLSKDEEIVKLKQRLESGHSQHILTTVTPSETVQKIIHGRPFLLEPYRSLEDKLVLFDAAIRSLDSSVILLIVVFLRKTLNKDLFMKELLHRPEAAQVYVNYLKQRGQYTEAVDYLIALGRIEEAYILKYHSSQKCKSADLKLRNLKEVLQTNVHYRKLDFEVAMVKQYIDLLELQLPIDEVDSKNSESNKMLLSNPRLCSVFDLPTLTTLYYCSMYHWLAQDNQARSPLSLRKTFIIPERPFLWTVLRSRARVQHWPMPAELENLIAPKGILGKVGVFVRSSGGGKSLKYCLPIDRIVDSLFVAGAPSTVLSAYIALLDSDDDKLKVAQSLQCHEVIIEVYINQKKWAALERYMEGLTVGSPEYIKVERALKVIVVEKVKKDYCITMDVNEALRLSKEKYFKTLNGMITYGTAGFRANSDELDSIAFRMGLLAVILSKHKNGAIGVMITASHNPVDDNGVKLIDPNGEMIEPSWEDVATQLVNANDEGIAEVLKGIVDRHEIQWERKALVFVGRDTRPSSWRLEEATKCGVKCLAEEVREFGVVSTPILHFIVAAYNSDGSYGIPSEEGYFQKLCHPFLKLRGETFWKGNYRPNMALDGANGVGADKMAALLERLRGTLNADLYNSGDGVLNDLCGADYVKTEGNWPNGVPTTPNLRCASVDGDADRLIYCYMDDELRVHVLDGDKIATLVADYLKQLMERADLNLRLGLIQTAYANGASTEYASRRLGIPVSFTKTGVKHLHEAAKRFDVGIYFEANGHGTVVFSSNAILAINEKFKEGRSSGIELYLAMSLINTIVGDALSDMLLVETILLSKGWSIQDWDLSYVEFPTRLRKVTVANRSVFTTTDAERICLTPEGLQEVIDALVGKYPNGRAFVRPSGTENIVRIFAESSTRESCDKLALDVAEAVYEKAGGIGPRPH